MQSLLEIVTAALVCIVVNGQTFGINEEDLFDCADYIFCDIRDIKGFRKVYSSYGPRAQEHGIGVVRDECDWPEVANNDESWNAIPDKFCPINYDEKKILVGLLGREITEFWAKVCDEGDMKECQAVEIGATNFSKFIAGYLTNGKCGAAAKAKGAMKLPGIG